MCTMSRSRVEPCAGSYRSSRSLKQRVDRALGDALGALSLHGPNRPLPGRVRRPVRTSLLGIGRRGNAEPALVVCRTTAHSPDWGSRRWRRDRRPPSCVAEFPAGGRLGPGTCRTRPVFLSVDPLGGPSGQVNHPEDARSPPGFPPAVDASLLGRSPRTPQLP